MMKFMKQNMVTYIAGLFGLSLTHSLVPIIMAFGMKDITDFAIEGRSDMLVRSIITVTAGMCILCVMYIVFSYIFRVSNRKTMASIKIRIFEHIQDLPMSYFDDTHSGEIVSRLNNDLYLMEMAYGGHLRNVITSLMSGLYSIIVMTYFDWRVSIMLVIFAFVATVINSRFSSIVKRIAVKAQVKNAEITKFAIEIFNALYTIKMFPCENTFLQRFNKENDEAASLDILSAKTGARYNSVNILIHWVNFIALLFVGALMAMKGLIKFGVVIGIIQLYGGVSSMFNSLGFLTIQLQNSIAGAERVLELIDLNHEPDRPGITFEKARGFSVGFSKVKFGYQKDNIVLHNINMCAEGNKVIAIVGPSGSGKSSVFKVLLGLYPIQEGHVEIAGKSFGDYKMSELRELIAYVPQDAYLFNTTIMENIRYGRKDATDEEVISAAKKAQIHDFIMGSPDQYNTLVGEKGIKLSGGQRQRIAIARAFVKESPIIFLDEATSALDSENEDKIQEIVYSQMSEKTVFVIAHRLSTVKNADYIYFIKDGCIAEEGTHDELFNRKGQYWNYCNYQFGDSNNMKYNVIDNVTGTEVFCNAGK
jgi:ABC-type multidrug transport system fused ATPase/permease subunit